MPDTQTLASNLHKEPFHGSRVLPMPMLRLMTCGSVDDGKSTLIGQLLLTTGSLHEDQLEALRRESQKHGTTGVSLDPALLLDGLEDERKQGITIDVAYRYFQTRFRKFIIADSPGHEQYTRNMATAASVSEVAIILVDARKGILPQTRRHSYIASLMGIRHVVLAVNKMDLVDYQKEVFDAILDNFMNFSQSLNFHGVQGIPISGLHADNIVSKSDKTPWYSGQPLLTHLENLIVNDTECMRELRFPVQRVCRPNLDFRGYCGTILSGKASVGDTVSVFPGGKKTRIKSIITMNESLAKANAGSPVTLTLEDDLDLSRGDMIAATTNPPQVSGAFQGMVVWMAEKPLDAKGVYLVRNGNRWTRAEIHSLEYVVRVENLEKMDSKILSMNQIGCLSIRTRDPLVFDTYQQNRHTGSFILVDPLTNETVAAGMISQFMDREEARNEGVSAGKNNLFPRTAETGPNGLKTITMVAVLKSHSTKMQMVAAVKHYCSKSGQRLLSMDAEGLRNGLANDLPISKEGNLELLRRALEVCKLVKNSVDITLFTLLENQIPTLAEIPEFVLKNTDLLIHDRLEGTNLDSFSDKVSLERIKVVPLGINANVVLVADFFEILKNETPIMGWLKLPQ